MLLCLALLATAVSALDLSLPIIPGLDVLGWGIDLRMSPYPELCLKLPIYTFEWTGRNNVTYFHPLYPKSIFRIPDDVSISNIGQVVSHTYTATTIDKLMFDLAVDLGISGDYTGANGTMFHGDLSVNYARKEFRNHDVRHVKNELQVGMYQLVIGPTVPMNPRVAMTISNMMLLDPNNKLEPLKFIERHGTHFIDSVMIGGMINIDTFADMLEGEDTNSFGIMARIGFENFLGLEKGHANFSLNFTESRKNFELNAYNKVITSGGDYSVAKFFEGFKNPRELYEEWQAKLINNPITIRFRARPIMFAIKDPALRLRIEAAYELYMNLADPLFPEQVSFIDTFGLNGDSGISKQSPAQNRLPF